MKKHRVQWLRLTIGYETLLAPAAGPPPSKQPLIEKTFTKAARTRWAKKGRTDLDLPAAPTPADDQWVRELLQHEIDGAVVAAKTRRAPSLTVGEVLTYGPQQAYRTAWTGKPGTRCELGPNGEWINTRTYRLTSDDGPWPPDATVLGYAALTWKCPGEGAESGAPRQQRKRQPKSKRRR